jgi:hypothetical protein
MTKKKNQTKKSQGKKIKETIENQQLPKKPPKTKTK